MDISIRHPTPGPETAGKSFLPGSSPPETQSPIDDLANSLHLALGVSPTTHNNPQRPRASSTSVLSDDPVTPVSGRHDGFGFGGNSHSLDETRSGTRSPGSVFSSSGIDDGPSPRSVQSLPLPVPTQTPFYRFIRRFSNSSVNAPTFLDLSADDPLYWVLSAGLTRARDSDLTDVDFARGSPPYIIRHVPHSVHDERKRSGLRVTVDVTRVINGTWYGRKAVFVGLSVAHTERKVPSTKVRVDVATGGLGDTDFDTYFADPSLHQPIIVRIAPKKHYGSANPIDQSTEVGVEGRIASPAAISNTGVTASINRTNNITLEKRQVITAFTSSEARQSTRTILQLEALENDVTRDGVYDQLPMGIVIETRGKPVVLTVDVEPKQKVFDSTFRYVATKYFWSVPVYIDHNDFVGDGLPDGLTREIDQWDQAVWKELVNYSVDYETILVGE